MFKERFLFSVEPDQLPRRILTLQVNSKSLLIFYPRASVQDAGGTMTSFVIVIVVVLFFVFVFVWWWASFLLLLFVLFFVTMHMTYRCKHSCMLQV